jgi:hypothetical protein
MKYNIFFLERPVQILDPPILCQANQVCAALSLKAEGIKVLLGNSTIALRKIIRM